jgi:hypothetical protein
LLGWPDIAQRGRDSPVISLFEGVLIVKKLLLVALVGMGAFALWRKVQGDRAELDLWTEATTGDDE